MFSSKMTDEKLHWSLLTISNNPKKFLLLKLFNQ